MNPLYEFSKGVDRLWTKQQWVSLKGRKVWFVGYHREYLPGSTEVKQVVVADGHELLSVTEFSISEWKEPLSNPAMESLNEIWNLSTQNTDSMSINFLQTLVAQIRNEAARGLGYAGRVRNA